MIPVKSGYTKKSQKRYGGVKNEVALLLRHFLLVFAQDYAGRDPRMAGAFLVARDAEGEG